MNRRLKRILWMFICTLFVSCMVMAEENTEESIVESTGTAGSVMVGDDVENVVAIAWENVEFDGGNGVVSAEELYFGFAGTEITAEKTDTEDADSMTVYQQQVHDQLWEDLGLGSLYIYKPENESILRYQYEGVAAEEIGDTEFCDYSSYYDIVTENQIRYITYDDENPYILYLKIFHEDSGNHDGFKIEWQEAEGDGIWKVARFDADTVETPLEAQIAAKYNFWDYTEYTVVTESTSLNVREVPGGKISHKLAKGTQITVYRHEQPAEDGTWFTLIAKYTEPDEEGWSKFEYYGWAATEYLEKEESYSWILCGGEANDRAEEKWNALKTETEETTEATTEATTEQTTEEMTEESSMEESTESTTEENA